MLDGTVYILEINEAFKSTMLTHDTFKSGLGETGDTAPHDD